MFFLRLYLVFLFFFIAPASASALERLAYYSDYFSFIGSDTKGFVAFALDNNRGIDGSDYQAEHFGVLYDEKSGWVELIGTGDYENVHGELKRIPNSSHFTFEGMPEEGIVVSSNDNALSLEIDPLVTQLKEKTDNRTQEWGVGKAVLNWNDRKIQGRVIYEHLIYSDWNRLTRTYAGTWDNFQGFYLLLRKGDFETWRDLYLRSEGKGNSRRTKGFVTVNEWSGNIHAKRFDAFDKAFNWGFYRWPQKWDIEIVPIDAEVTKTGKLTLRQISRKNQGNWVIGGFAMTVVEGEIRLNGEVTSVIGFVELIK
jgi:hypothetical protein